MSITVSVIIRTYNEQRYLEELLHSIKKQNLDELQLEIILVDSGSTDKTIEIAQKHNCKIQKIKKTEFTFGYSLNVGCENSVGQYLIFISGHCIPLDENWLKNLISPLISKKVEYTYGRQIGRDSTRFSENVHFEKTFPQYNKLPQNSYFCNNANAAITKECWEKYRFDEKLTGLEDMHLAKEMMKNGYKVGYVANACVYHIHNETWGQVMNRYEREAYALQKIATELHFTKADFFRFFLSGIFADYSKAIEKKCFIECFFEILKFRLYMYWGTYKGNKEHRELSNKMKMAYFYPKDQERKQYE